MAIGRVQIVDATLREGNQAPGVAFTTEQSVEIARLLAKLGVDMIECGHASASKAEFARTAAVAALGLGVPVMSHARARWEDIRAVADAGAAWVGIFCGVNDMSLRLRLVGKKPQEVLSQIYDSITYARGLGLKVRYTIEDASRTSFDRMIATYRRAIEAGANRICFADTLGLQDPAQIATILRRLKQEFPELELEVHLHDDRGLALANALAALEAGAEWVSTSVNGLGERCGIVDLAVLWANLVHLGVRDLRAPAALQYLSRYVAAAARSPVEVRHPVVGRHAFTHKARLHVKAVESDEMAYSWQPPAVLGRTTSTARISSSNPADLVTRATAICSTELRYHRAGPGTRYVMIDDRFVPDARQYCIVRSVPEQHEPPPEHVDAHRHVVDSLFLFLGNGLEYAGLEVEVRLGDERLLVSSPSSVFIPAGVLHSYRFLSGSGTFLNHVLCGNYDDSLLDTFVLEDDRALDVDTGREPQSAADDLAPQASSRDPVAKQSGTGVLEPCDDDKRRLIEFLSSRTGMPTSDITGDLNLVDAGLLDSLLVIELFFFVEGLVGAPLSTENFRIDLFDTVDKIHRSWILPHSQVSCRANPDSPRAGTASPSPSSG